MEESLKTVAKALDAIETAEHYLQGNFTLAAINRIYYACYYCMTALLQSQNVFTKTHQGTRAKFSELFIKTGLFSDDMAVHIKNAFDLRQEADYDLDAEISYEIASLMIVKTKELHNLAIAYLQSL